MFYYCGRMLIDLTDELGLSRTLLCNPLDTCYSIDWMIDFYRLDRYTYFWFAPHPCTMNHLLKYQESLIDMLASENANYETLNSQIDIEGELARAREAQLKLINIRRDMIKIREQADRIKKRALKLHEDKQKQALEEELERQRQASLERELEAKINPRYQPSTSGNSTLSGQANGAESTSGVLAIGAHKKVKAKKPAKGKTRKIVAGKEATELDREENSPSPSLTGSVTSLASSN